jgi:hypothetical protein
MKAMSSWCPISEVVVKGSPLDHFLVTVEPDTIVHGDTATVHVQDSDNEDIELDGETLLNALLDAAGQTYGKLIGAALPGPLVEMSYEEVKAGKLRYVANGDDPTGLPAQQVKISVVLSDDETKEGIGTVAVKASIEKFCQNNPDWAGADYDKYVDPVETKKQGKTVYYKIARKGCALTCMAMVAKAGGTNVNPGSLNEWMTSNHGFRGTEGGVVWGAIDGFDSDSKYKSSPTFQGSGLQFHDDRKTVDLENSSTVSLSSMDPFLEKGALIAAEVYNPSTKNAHWVLVVRKSSNGYGILDPGCYQDRTTLGGEYANSVYKFMVYHRK